jgi:6-phosphofructokinase 1
MIRRIALVTSGSDAPGMNAAIRAVTRTALEQGWEVQGIHLGFAGLLGGDFAALTARSVGGIIQRGGTMLGSAPSKEFLTEGGRRRAIHNLAEREIDALVVIGGDGSQAGALALFQMGFPVNGVPSSIDNDLVGTDITIGVDTALNVALEAIDELKVTASSHHRAFLVGVAGRQCGYVALMSGIAGGAEAIVLPEAETTPEQVAATLRVAYEHGKSHAIIVVAEGGNLDVTQLSQRLGQIDDFGFELQATDLSHIQRGGAPGAFDRILGTRLGVCAVEALARGEYGILAGSVGSGTVTTPLSEVVGKSRVLDQNLLRLAAVLAL